MFVMCVGCVYRDVIVYVRLGEVRERTKIQDVVSIAEFVLRG